MKIINIPNTSPTWWVSTSGFMALRVSTAALTKLLRNGTNYEEANRERNEKWFKTNKGCKQATHAQIAQYTIVYKT